MNDQLIKKINQEIILKFQELKENESTKQENLWDT